ncbi:MAG: pyrimidine-nucleoside phosphorylase, partial [Mycoplasmataceae bacterium]|nr:pyrimidine-nucleoside phosphorylase [Mycoplasmataceae bacterium]
MRITDLIDKKKLGQELNEKELAFIINGFLDESIADYQMSSFLMAVYFKGMTSKETSILTILMMNSGEVFDLSAIKGIKVDKHSTGGVGDKVSLVVGPIVA